MLLDAQTGWTHWIPIQTNVRNMKARKRANDISVSDRLINAAEALYGERGLDGVSLRQISQAAGTCNNYAVQYHFGDAAGLIQAVLARRMPDVERCRAEYLAAAKNLGRLDDTRALMDILYLPLLDHKNAAGERAYARFVLALLSAPAGARHRANAFHQMPIADHVVDLIAKAHADIPPDFLLQRQRTISFMVLTGVTYAPPDNLDLDMALVNDTLNMATAALTAPASPQICEIFQRNRTD